MDKERDPVKKWLNAVGREGTGAKNTRYNYQRQFTRLTEELKLKPIELLQMAKRDPDELTERLDDWYNDNGEHRQMRYSEVITMKSYLSHNGVKDFEYKVRRPEYKPRNPLTKESITKLLSFCNPKLKAILLVGKDSGLAPADILNLRYWQVAEAEKGEKFINIRLNREKTEEFTGTFCGPEATDALRDYLRIRREKAGEIGDDDYVFSAGAHLNRSWDYHSMKKMLDRARRLSDVKLKFSDLRTFFSSQLHGSGGPDFLFTEQWMGHNLGINKNYFRKTPEEHLQAYKDHYSTIALAFSGEMARKEEIEKLRKEVEDLKASITTTSSHVESGDLDKIRAEIARIRDQLDFYPMPEMSDVEKLRKAEEILGKPKHKRKRQKGP